MEVRPFVRSTLFDESLIHNWKLLYACESGSRLWGFPSPDSDYDVRFVYSNGFSASYSFQEIDNKKRFSLSLKEDNSDYDIVGWELRDFIEYIIKNDASVYEWLHAPDNYKYLICHDFASDFVKFCEFCYSRSQQLYHYRGLGRKFLSKINNEPYSCKDVAYLLRSLLMSKWIMQSDAIANPDITELLRDLKLMSPQLDLRTIIYKILDEKTSLKESDYFRMDYCLLEYCNSYFDLLKPETLSDLNEQNPDYRMEIRKRATELFLKYC